MKTSLTRLGDMVTLKRGHDLPSSNRQSGDVPIVSSSGITGFHNEAKAAGPGIVTGRYGTIGQVFYVEEDYWPLNTALYAVDLKENHPRFIAYFLEHVLRDYQSDKAAVPGVDRNVLHEMRVVAPPKSAQEPIAGVLSAYDELIENNRRRMVLLEDAARQLYREWFVRLRFPGYEHTRIVNGVPDGWRRDSLMNLCESVAYGYTASAESEGVGPKLLRITDIVPRVIDWDSVPFCIVDEKRFRRFELQGGDIVVARTGATVGYAKRLHRRHPPAVFASYLVRLRPKADVSNLMMGVFMESKDYKDYVLARIGGAAQPNANAKVLSAAEIFVPSPTIRGLFDEFTEPMVDQMEILQLQNQKLRTARDLLLPRLMSGEITV